MIFWDWLMNAKHTSPTLQQLKQSLDILTVANMYGELIKTGKNFKYKNDKSIVINPAKQIFSNFNGDIIGGSVLDLVIYMERLNMNNGIKRLKELSSLRTYDNSFNNNVLNSHQTKAKQINFKQLDYFAKKELEAVKNKTFTIKHDKQILLLDNRFIQLFETDIFYLNDERVEMNIEKQLIYLFNNYLGWNDFFQCPSIILKDNNDKIVDVISYRPTKPKNYTSWDNPKYIYKNSHNRGDDFLYPFQKEVEKALKKKMKKKYLIVGEGLKNGLNAVFYEAPYITIESTSNKLNDKLKNYILHWYNSGYIILCMFDGDNSGKQAYQKFIKEIGHDFSNFLDFKSGLDFVSYLQSP
jgi:hypothetical protein